MGGGGVGVGLITYFLSRKTSQVLFLALIKIHQLTMKWVA